MDGRTARAEGFDGAAAVTRSLLGYGVLAGALYLVAGTVLAVNREGFDLARHPLSLLMLGEGGWMQRANLILAGSMTIAAGLGFSRAMRGAEVGGRTPLLIAVYGACVVASGIFPPDPMEGFPPGSAGGEASLSGIAHLAFGAVGFVSLAVATFAMARWCADRAEGSWATYSRGSGAVIIVGFVAGAALATMTVGVVALWVAVVTGWVWLAAVSIHAYGTVPHPDAHRRAPAAD